jgi:hypothetical protein
LLEVETQLADRLAARVQPRLAVLGGGAVEPGEGEGNARPLGSRVLPPDAHGPLEASTHRKEIRFALHRGLIKAAQPAIDD